MENQDLSDVTDRLKEIIHYSQLTHGAFAVKIGVQNSTLAHIILGRNTPSLTVIQKVLLAFPEINADYLLLGKGEPMNSNKTTNNKPNNMNNELINKKLFQAVESGDIKSVETVLQEEKLNAASYYGAKCIVVAVERESTDILTILLENSKNVNRSSFWSNKYRLAANTLLQTARSQRTDLLKVLLQYGANADKKDLKEAFVETLLSGNYEALKLLVDAGANVNIKDSKGFSPLMYAVLLSSSNQKLIVECLLSAGAHINTKITELKRIDNKMVVQVNTALTFAEKSGNLEIVEMIKNAKKRKQNHNY